MNYEGGSYPTLGVWYDFTGPPFPYIHQCEEALGIFNGAIAWGDLREHLEEALTRDVDAAEEEDGDADGGDVPVGEHDSSEDRDAEGRVEAGAADEPGCASCWALDAADAWAAFGSTSINHYLADESHFIVSIRACPECGQLYVLVTTEMIDWKDGNDPIHRIALPISDVERATLEAAEPFCNDVLESVGVDRRALNFDWPNDDDAVTYWGKGILVRPHD